MALQASSSSSDAQIGSLSESKNRSLLEEVVTNSALLSHIGSFLGQETPALRAVSRGWRELLYQQENDEFNVRASYAKKKALKASFIRSTKYLSCAMRMTVFFKKIMKLGEDHSDKLCAASIIITAINVWRKKSSEEVTESNRIFIQKLAEKSEALIKKCLSENLLSLEECNRKIASIERGFSPIRTDSSDNPLKRLEVGACISSLIWVPVLALFLNALYKHCVISKMEASRDKKGLAANVAAEEHKVLKNEVLKKLQRRSIRSAAAVIKEE